jgi:hypothetical protein
MDSNRQQSTRSVIQATNIVVYKWNIFYYLFEQYITAHTFFARVDEDKS